MANSQLRKIKEVNGWRINHPHSAANIFFTILMLILVASPAAYLFLDTAALVQAGNPSIVTDYSFNGIDLIKMTIELVKKMIGIENTHIDSNSLLYFLTIPEYTGALSVAAPYLLIASTFLLVVMFVFSFITFILFIVILIKGYLKRSGAIKAFVLVDFLSALLFSLIYLVLYFGFRTSTTGGAGSVDLAIWNNFYILSGYLVLLIIISIVYGNNFKDSIPESELEYHDQAPTVEHISQVHEVTKVSYEQSSTLPPNLTEIGGHAFAENLNLVVANIPENITKLGSSAFANCLKLKVVSIPNTVKEIGYNCFFNCCDLERINYGGTKAEWKNVVRGSNWLLKAGTTEVTCVDGRIIVSPYH